MGEGDKNESAPKARIAQDKPLLPKRFYNDASVEERDGTYVILLDGRAIKTPNKHDFALPTRALADAIADEWRAQGERIDPATMPLTRIANTAIDAVAIHMDAVAADIEAFAGNDLVCYRSEGPAGLLSRECAAWDPVLTWAEDVLGARFTVGQGIMPIEQPQASVSAVGKAVSAYDAFELASLHIMTTLAGSALIALAHAAGRLSLEEAWDAAHVDEIWQAEQWGWDAEAQKRVRLRREEFSAASRLLALLRQ